MYLLFTVIKGNKMLVFHNFISYCVAQAGNEFWKSTFFVIIQAKLTVINVVYIYSM